MQSTSRSRRVRLTKNLPAVARACDRYGLSDRSAVAVASAVLQDFGIISEGDSKNVIDRNKIRKSRQLKRNDLQILERSDGVRAVYFDGRNDHTITNIPIGSRWYRKKVVEEHVSLIEEPCSKYIGHITPISGTSEAIKSGIIGFLRQRFGYENKLNSCFNKCYIIAKVYFYKF